jgi:catechol 2,3-dioxygenase-like lactoylglutathione lyase family enzyme
MDAAARKALADKHIVTTDRPPSTARGVHHMALLSSDVERTIDFYQGLLGFPLTEVMENRDYPNSTHFFFDLGPYAEVLGGLHHLAISITRENWDVAVAKLRDAGVDVHIESGLSAYFRDPDGARLELLAEPLGVMYGAKVV